MVGVRGPERLEASALSAWLRALDTAVGRGEGVHASLPAPPALLVAALRGGGAGLREAVLARLAVAAVAAGVSHLEVHLEHPTLLEALFEALASHPSHINSLALTMGPRTTLTGYQGLVCQALRGMSSITNLTLTPAATDAHLAALATACPPLHTLDLSYCTAITDKGVRALLGVGKEPRTVKEVVEGQGIEGVSKTFPAATLHTLNLWGTDVTTRGCVLLLSCCSALKTLTCRWLCEALDVVVRGGRTLPLALTQLLLAEVPLPPLHLVTDLCPNLTSLVARYCPDSISVEHVLEAATSLTSLTLLQFMPSPNPWLPTLPVTQLTSLHLCLLDPRPVELSQLAHTFPTLTHLSLEGVRPTLSNPDPPTPTSRLQFLRLMTSPIQSHVIEPRVVVWALVWATGAVSLDLGFCTHLEDQHLSQALASGALKQVEDFRLSGAAQVTDSGIDDLVTSCPHLRRLALKMLPMERLAQLEALKLRIRDENLDLELITYGWRF